ncbi:MAG: MFS transporter [Verrucomicrobiota bacterium JB022]|nr:MFS transporter [Verrucomicrobiota bacterium JB022]
MKADILPAHSRNVLTRSTVLLLATITGLAVATLYYSQPMLALMGRDLHYSDGVMSLVPMLTQMGYAAGLLFLGPLGDRHDRRRIVMIKAVLLIGALVASAAAPSMAVLAVASLLIGLTSTLAQDVVSGTAMLAPDHSRGKTVGTVMTGLLLGILVSRVVSGFVAEYLGWREMFYIAAASIGGLLVIAWRGMPSTPVLTQLRYGALMASLGHLWQKYPSVRRAAIAQGLVAVSFSAFWSTLALILHGEPFHLGSTVAGIFGIAGAAGALIAPFAGKLADRHGPEVVTRLSTALSAASFGIMAFAPFFAPSHQVWLLVAGVIGFDLGMQATTVSHQTIIYGIDPAARSRLNAILLFGMFAGMSAGAGLGGWILGQFGWLGVVALAVTSSALAFVVRLTASTEGGPAVGAPATARS